MGLDVAGIGSVADFAKTVVDKVFPDRLSEGERAKAELEIQRLAAARDATVINARRDVIAAELAQEDNYTKRARPTVIYTGLVFIGIVHVLFPVAAFFSGKAMPQLSLPYEFWLAWGGICSVYSLGRSAEKRAKATGAPAGKLVSLITGGAS